MEESNVKLWIDKTKKEIKDDKNWAKLRVKKDKETDIDYIDVLIGVKNKSAHIHFGLNLDNSMKFIETRDIMKAISRKVESKKYGLIQDEKVIIDKSINNVSNTIIQLTDEGSTGEVTIKRFEFEVS